MSFNTSSDTSSNFEWDEYLLKTNGHAADAKCFKQSLVPPPNHFEVGSLLEAEDQRSTALEIQNLPYVGESVRSRSSISSTPVDVNRRNSLSAAPLGTLRRFRAAAFSLARVVEVWGARIRVRLVGTDDRNDCWFLVDSDQIRSYPSGNLLQPPFGYMHNHLVWDRTLKKATEGAKFADASWFIKPPPDPPGNCFQLGDKLEAIDRRNAQLICPATVGEVNGDFIMVRFDGWSGAFDYWTRFDSRELFPVGWCKKAEYPLQSPGPNALRSPGTYSTPAQSSRVAIPNQLNSLADSGNQISTPYVRFSKRLVDDKWNSRFKRPRRPRGKRPRITMKSRRLVNSKCRMKLEIPDTEDHERPIEDKRKRSLHIKHSAPNWPVLSGHPEQFSPSTVTGLPPPALSDDSADWSARSLSSPPLIHREEDDDYEVRQSGNYSLVNSISDNSDKHPPPIGTSCAGRDRKLSGPGSGEACVVRLQARSTTKGAPPFSTSSADTLQRIHERDGSRMVSPELKSWQVVTAIGTENPVESRGKEHKKTSKRHKRYGAEREASKLHKKLKLVNHHHASDSVSGKSSTSDSTAHHQSSGAIQQTSSNCRTPFDSINATQTLTHNLESTVDALAKIPLGSPSGHPVSPPLSFHNCPPSVQVPLHLCCDDCHPGTAASAALGGYPLMHSVTKKRCCAKSTFCRRDMMLAHEYNDKIVDEVRDSTGSCPESGGFTNRIAMVVDSGWSTTQETGTTTRLAPYSDSVEQTSSDTAPQPSDDYLTDALSLSAHMPSSSTVSPSSLDLGPCPLPKPTMWTIDEVYHYITTRDNSLLEVAEKFKHHEIDGQALLLLSMESLRNYLKVKLGPALKVDHLITRLKRGLL